MNKAKMDRDLLSTCSYPVLHSQMPKLTKESYFAIMEQTANWIARLIQLRQQGVKI